MTSPKDDHEKQDLGDIMVGKVDGVVEQPATHEMQNGHLPKFTGSIGALYINQEH